MASCRAVAAVAAVALLLAPPARGQSSIPACVFWFPDVGYQYDISSLAAATPYAHAVGTTNFQYSFCNNITTSSCPDGTKAVSMMVAPGTGCIASYGTLPSVAASPYGGNPTSGLTLVATGTQPCGGSGPAPQTTFNLQCDTTITGAPLVRSASYVAGSCTLLYNLATSAACPTVRKRVVTPLSPGWIAFITLAVSGAIYLVGGVAYKTYWKGASGVEAIPNIDSWRALGRGLRAIVTCQCLRGPAGASRLGATSGGDGSGGVEDGYYRSYDEL